MESLSPLNTFINRHTPVRRLGLSRKRKNTPSPSVSQNSVNVEGGDSPVSSSHESFPKIRRRFKQNLSEENNTIKSSLNAAEASSENIDYEKEIELVQNRIDRSLKTLQLLKSKNRKIIELENLIDVWKIGCKKAYLHLAQLIKDRQKEKSKPKEWLTQLGVWNVMTENFRDDSEVSLSDDSE